MQEESDSENDFESADEGDEAEVSHKAPAHEPEPCATITDTQLKVNQAETLPSETGTVSQELPKCSEPKRADVAFSENGIASLSSAAHSNLEEEKLQSSEVAEKTATKLNREDLTTKDQSRKVTELSGDTTERDKSYKEPTLPLVPKEKYEVESVNKLDLSTISKDPEPLSQEVTAMAVPPQTEKVLLKEKREMERAIKLDHSTVTKDPKPEPLQQEVAAAPPQTEKVLLLKEKRELERRNKLEKSTVTKAPKPEPLQREVVAAAPPQTEKVLLLKEKREMERANKMDLPTVPKDRKPTPFHEEEKNSPGWSLVGGWSSSFISSVASSASTFTSHVTQGIGTVLETMEATLGAPPPEEMAALKKAESTASEVSTGNHAQTTVQEKSAGPPVSAAPEAGHAPGGGLFGGVSALTRALETTGSKVITGGLDTLELIGKKTMDILTEGDPGLRKKRTLFGGPETTLSQVLKDAKEKYEDDPSVSEDAHEAVHYSKLFDEFQGLVHLEALEILSGHSKAKLEEQLLILGAETDPLHETLEELHAICLDLPPTDDTPDDEATQDFEKLVNEHISALPIKLNIEKIKSVQSETRNWVSQCSLDQEKGEVKDANEIYVKIITSLAELTARAMELFHKMSELLLVTGSDLADLKDIAHHFTGLTAILCTEVGILTSQFCHCLSTAADDSEDPDSINPLITNVYLEASNSNTYIQDAFQLLIPIFQEIAAKS